MAGKFDDQQLRQLALKLTDPYDQPDLLTTLPDDAQLLDVINVYSYDQWPAQKVYCVRCGGRRHKHGFTALLASGHRLLYGSSCGCKQFGEKSWKTAERSMLGRADRKFELKKLDRFELLSRDLTKHLGWWAPVLQKVGGRRKAFARNLGELSSRCVEVARRDDRMMTITRKREFNAYLDAKQRAQLGEFETVPFGTMKGAEFFSDQNIEVVAELADNAIARYKECISNTAMHTTTQLATRRRAVERAFEELERACKVYLGALDFFNEVNLRLVLRWVNENDITSEKYRLSADKLLCPENDETKGIQLLEFPDLKEVELLDIIRDFRRAD